MPLSRGFPKHWDKNNHLQVIDKDFSYHKLDLVTTTDKSDHLDKLLILTNYSAIPNTIGTQISIAA